MKLSEGPLRPNHNETGDSISLRANYFKFTLASSSDHIYKYSVSFSPDLSQSLGRLREKIISKIKRSIIESIGKFVFANTALYSTQTTSEKTFESDYDGISYSVTISPAGFVESPLEVSAFYNKFFNSVQGKNKLVMIGKKFYNPDKAVTLTQHNISIWPGYSSAVGNFEAGCMVNIDISHRCLRTITVYDQLEDLKSKKLPDFRGTVSKLLIGASVLTLYNKRNYKIDNIDWNLSPLSSFKDHLGSESTFKAYYTKKWGKNIEHDDQPLLVSTIKNAQCLLVPEFCVVTGLTDEMRNDFNIMKDIANATKKEPCLRLKESAGLIKSIKANQNLAREIENWRCDISEDPVKINARVLSAGNILMGEKNQFKINENSGNFDRDVQNTMFSQNNIDKWGVFFCESDRKLVEQTLMPTLAQVIKTFKVQSEKPNLFAVKTDKWNDWDTVLRKSLNSSVKIIICVLPGSRGKSRIYDDLKKLTFSTLPVPTQVILNATLKKEKGLRSVINKVIVQINAKNGGVPWAIKDVQIDQEPTMLIGIDVFHKKGAKSVLGFCATTDKNFAKYVSIPNISMPNEEITSQICDSVMTSLRQFYSENKNFPSRIIVFRDGVSNGQRNALLETEVPQFKLAFEKMRIESKGFSEPKMIFLVVNKRVNARFYMEQGEKITNPPIGTIVDREVVDAKGYDFYVLPAKATQGAMTPTHFYVVYDDTGLKAEEIHKVAYRMCFAYYNWSGSIRVPAPCQYAHKLAYQFGERTGGPPVPHLHWQTTRSLYFL